MARDIINFEVKPEIRNRLSFLTRVTGIESMSSILRNLVIKESDSYGFRADQQPPCPDQDGPALTNHQ
jgi:hypothetical protein